MDIQTFFKYGLDRDIPPLARVPLNKNGVEYASINLAPGKHKKIPAIPVGLNSGGGARDANGRYVIPWQAPETLPFPDESVGEIHAYQFLEHLEGEDAIKVLRECERVLVPGGVLNIVVPHAHSQHFTQALDHKSMWTEETWNWLFGNQYYDDHEGEGWKLRVHTCFLMAVVYRNLDVFTQLVKE